MEQERGGEGACDLGGRDSRLAGLEGTRWIWILQDEHFRGQQTLSQARRLADSREEFLPRG